MKEKKAALTIERFFIFVKAEVDREVQKREAKRLTKEKKRREQSVLLMQSGGKAATGDGRLKTVNENTTAASATTEESSRSKGTPRQSESNVNLTPIKGVNPKLHVGSNDPPAFHRSGQSFSLDSPCHAKPPTDSVQVKTAPSKDFSVVSNITNPSVFHKMSKQELKTTLTDTTDAFDFEPFHEEVRSIRNEKDIWEESHGFEFDDLSFQKEARPRSTKSEKHRLTTEDYIRKYGGLKTTPNRVPNSNSANHFFSEGATPQTRKKHPLNGTPTSYKGTGSTPRSQSFSQQGNRSSSVGPSKRKNSLAPINTNPPRSSSVGPSKRQNSITPLSTHQSTLGHSPRVPSTPKSTTSRSSKRSGSTPRHSASTPKSTRKYGSTPTSVKRSSSAPTSSGKHPSHFLPLPTPTGRHKGISLPFNGTCETESLTTVNDTIYSMPSPRRHSSSATSRVHDGKNPVMILKTYPDLEDGQSLHEAHEILLLGDEYGEV